ncbi:cyanuric acid hydrolase/Barbiturase [Lipomyces japonicus]|uniref:cyanuric acid hydrolase/Barbiturase n=1 Tax=Lipomyces japonicus TaxID=56871 RepID=UPI0034CD519A
MPGVKILKATTAHPGDTSPLSLLSSANDEQQLLAVIGKTEGNGCVNDFTRMLSSTVWDPHVLPSGGVTVFSGGTEGVLSPHVSFIVTEPDHHQDESNTSTYEQGLAAAVGHTRGLQPWEMGTIVHARLVAAKVSSMLHDDLQVQDPADVHMVLVKCPLLTTAKIVSGLNQGKDCVTTDTYKSMAWSRLAAALGVAVALGEIPDTDDAILAGLESYGKTAWSSRASCSSGAELEDNHIVILASSKSASNPYRGLHGFMNDAIDLESLLKLKQQIPAGAKQVQIFVKAEPSTDGLIRGNRHTMMTDSDIQGTRHARAAVGGLVSGVWGSSDVYVSGGAEGQGPMGGGSVCVVYKV